MARRKTTRVTADEGQTTALTVAAPAADDVAAVAPPPLPAPMVSMVFRWILDGHTEHDVREAIAEKWPDAPAGPLIVAAVERFLEAGKFQPEIMFGWCAEAYREIYRRAMDAGDVASALRAVKLLAQLAGY